MTTYPEFLKSKQPAAKNYGLEIEPDEINPVLFPFQRDLVKWSVRKGRCALFADTGLGKTLMQAEWARLIGQKTLFIAPLSVARQTVKQAREHLGLEILYVRSQAQVDAGPDQRLFITNYEMIEHFEFA
jgi:superfamily II DNA or RNA helicase